MSALSTALFERNAWPNLRLADACADLADSRLDGGVPGTYGTI